MNIVIVGLRRSGTTAFWGAFRQDDRFVGYNEPYNAQLANVGAPDWNGARYTGREYVALYERDPALFWERYAPIPRHTELQDGLGDRQRTYLGWLQSTGDHTCVDVTRCHFKLDGVRDVDPEAVVVHLYRPPANWVTSVTMPSTTHIRRRGRWQDRVRHTVRLKVSAERFRRQFWTARDAHKFKGFEELIGTHPGTAFGVRLDQAGMDARSVYAMPDVGRLLAFWKLHFDHVEREGRRLFGDRFLSVNFNNFCRSPSDVVATVYERAGLDRPALDLSGIHPPPAPYAADDSRWAAYAEQLDLPRLS